MVLWSRCHGTSDDTEIAGRWEFIETSQYKVHRGEKTGKNTKATRDAKAQKINPNGNAKKDKNSKTIV